MRKILSMLLALTMIFSVIPMQVLAINPVVLDFDSAADDSEGVNADMEKTNEDDLSDDAEEHEVDAEEAELTSNVEISYVGNSSENGEIPENYGVEVVVEGKRYYIEDGALLCSENNASPVNICDGASFVIEEEGVVYYAVPDGYNTCIFSVDREEMLTKLFVPIDCFDVDGKYLYYSYNGEVTRLNLESSEEDVVAVGNTKLFCVKNGVGCGQNC